MSARYYTSKQIEGLIAVEIGRGLTREEAINKLLKGVQKGARLAEREVRDAEDRLSQAERKQATLSKAKPVAKAEIEKVKGTIDKLKRTIKSEQNFARIENGGVVILKKKKDELH
jgi:hypothetical protein